MEICKICGKGLTKRRLKIHLRNEHGVTDKEYFLSYLDKSYVYCEFCGKESHFNNMFIGYNTYCKQCGKKFYSREFRREQGLITEEEEKRYRQKHKENSIKMHEKARSENDDYIKIRVPSNKEFWILKGFTEEEAENIISMNAKNANNQFKKIKREQPEKFESCNPTKLKYWLLKGYSEEEAKQKLSERQTTFSLEICIEKYGEDEGKKRWQERQNKWLQSLVDKPYNEKIDMIKKKMKISSYEKELMFWFEDNKIEYESQFVLLGDKVWVYDFRVNNKLIEFNGDYYHCNPEIYIETFKNKVKNKTAKQIREEDEIKKQAALESGYGFYVVWEKDYNDNKEETLKKLMEFINNEF